MEKSPSSKNFIYFIWLIYMIDKCISIGYYLVITLGCLLTIYYLTPNLYKISKNKINFMKQKKLKPNKNITLTNIKYLELGDITNGFINITLSNAFISQNFIFDSKQMMLIDKNTNVNINNQTTENFQFKFSKYK